MIYKDEYKSGEPETWAATKELQLNAEEFERCLRYVFCCAVRPYSLCYILIDIHIVLSTDLPFHSSKIAT